MAKRGKRQVLELPRPPCRVFLLPHCTSDYWIRIVDLVEVDYETNAIGIAAMTRELDAKRPEPDHSALDCIVPITPTNQKRYERFLEVENILRDAKKERSSLFSALRKTSALEISEGKGVENVKTTEGTTEKASQDPQQSIL